MGLSRYFLSMKWFSQMPFLIAFCSRTWMGCKMATISLQRCQTTRGSPKHCVKENLSVISAPASRIRTQRHALFLRLSSFVLHSLFLEDLREQAWLCIHGSITMRGHIVFWPLCSLAALFLFRLLRHNLQVRVPTLPKGKLRLFHVL